MNGKKIFALMLVFAMLLTSMNVMVFGKNESKQNKWYDDVIEKWTNSGELSSDDRITINPEESITREEFVKHLFKQVDLIKGDFTSLSDVEQLKWFIDFKNALNPVKLNESIKSLVNPTEKISREEAIVIVSVYLSSELDKDALDIKEFADYKKISNWAQVAIKKAKAKGIIVGNNGNLRPLDKLTGAELLTLLDRISSYIDYVPPVQEYLKISFEDGVPSYLAADSTEVELVNDYATDGVNAIKVNYLPAQFPGISFTPEQPWDWGTDNCLAFSVTNPTDQPVTLYVRVDDNVNSDGANNSTVSIASIQPNSTQRMYMGFSENSLDLGMRSFPEGPAGTNIGFGWGKRSLNISNITKVIFWMMDLKQETTLYFDNIEVIPDPGKDFSYLDGFVNEFGQYTGEDWEGKVTSDDDLIASKDNELAKYEAEKDGLVKRSTYGGWLEGPKLEATGYFRVEKYDGKWTMVDPEGYLFFATGVDIIRLGDNFTWIDGRNSMYDSIPSQDGPLGNHYSYIGPVARSPLGLEKGWAFNFYSANLERKYGEDYLNEWKDMTLKRMENWGFSTLGNWSDPTLFLGKGEENKIPYAAQGWINGDFARISSGTNEFWQPIPDAFDPAFREAARATIEEVESYGVSDDKWCMGIYLDNEIAWGNPISNDQKYAVAMGAFRLDAKNESSYGKRAIIAVLKEKYNNDIEELNTAWETDIDTWAALEAPYIITDLTAGTVEDLSMALSMLAEEYFKVIDEELNAVMPNILNLGVRFAEWGTSLEVQQACAKYADIVSFNVYKKGVTEHDWIYDEELDMPLIVGEFTFKTTGRGYIGTGLQSSLNFEQRGVSYQEYIKTALGSPYFVGAHWFQYMDQPLTGRAWDGENYNCGFVDVTDEPYTDLVNAAKDIHANVYDLKFNPVEVTEVKLEQEIATIDLSTNPKLQLKATVLPDNADFKGVKWSSADASIAKVDVTGMVTALKAGTVNIVATSEHNPSVSATCAITVKTDAADMPTISFEENEDLSYMSTIKEATTETVTQGSTDGASALKVNVGTLDTDYSTLIFDAEGTWNFADLPLMADITNPNNEDIQVRVNVTDNAGQLRTYYFNIAANESKTITVDAFDAQGANWGATQGFWGAEASGINKTKVDSLSFYLWEDKPDATANTFIIDNIRLNSSTSIPAANMPTISFEENEDLSYMSPQKQATVEYVTTNATDGSKALKVNVGTLDTDYSPLDFDAEGTWSFGESPTLMADVTNPNNEDIQVRVNVKDDAGQLRTYYFVLAANEQKTIEISVFDAQGANWGATEGFWGAESSGISISKVDLISFYLWEDKPDATANTYIIDNIRVIKRQQ